MIQGVLFDMDGLMFDTERIGYEGWKYAGKKLGIHMKDELIASFRGTGEKEKRRHFKEAFGSEELYDEAFTLRTVYAKEWASGKERAGGAAGVFEKRKYSGGARNLDKPQESDGLSGYGKCNRIFQCISVR